VWLLLAMALRPTRLSDAELQRGRMRIACYEGLDFGQLVVLLICSTSSGKGW